MRMFVACFSAIFLASCITPKPGPEATVEITIRPTETGLSATYALPALATRFPFEDDAGGLRTDGWSTPTAGATIEDKAITFAMPTGRFELAITPDRKQRDRVYAGLTPVGDGWLIYAPHLEPAKVGSLTYKLAFDLPDGWTIVGHRDETGALAPDGYVFIGPETYIERGETIVVTAPGAPAWLRADILKAANDAAALYSTRLGVALASKPSVVISVFPEDGGSGMRGDVTPGAMVSVRFYGAGWTEKASSDISYVKEFVAHEVFHLWNGDLVDSADNETRPWLHEGGASYAAILALDPTPTGDSKSLLAGINDNLVQCQSALKEDESLMTADMRSGQTPYTCGVVLQWAWDAGLRATSHDTRDVLSLWKDVVADARRGNDLYSVESTLRRVPTEANIAADILVNRTGAERWSQFANAMRGYGAELIPGRSNEEDRATALMHLLGAHCQGQRGFTTMDDYLVLDTGDRCGPLNGDAAFDAVAGHDAIKDASAMYDRVREICASGGVVDFTRHGEVVASATCSAPLRAPVSFLKVTRAFGDA